jgi:hypothetical protein
VGAFSFTYYQMRLCRTDFSDIVGAGLDIVVKKLTELFGRQYLNHQAGQAGQALSKWDRRVQAACSPNGTNAIKKF